MISDSRRLATLMLASTAMLGTPFAPEAQHDGGDPGGNLPTALCYYYEECIASTFEMGDRLPDWHAGQWGVQAEPTYAHTSCLVCADDDGDNGVCHYSCSQGQASNEHWRLAHRSAFQAFLRDDLLRILEQAPTLGTYLVWNESRSAVQLFDCSGEVVLASKSVGQDGVEKVASLPRYRDRGSRLSDDQ